jgi:Icc protein
MPATILQLSDTHLPEAPGERVYDLDADERLAAVLAAWTATGEHADLVLLTGDLANEADASSCERLASAVSALNSPVLALPGNHDRPEVVADVWGGDDTAEAGGWRVLAVDTTIPGAVHGAVDVDAVLGRLDELDDRATVLALHHPPLSRSTHPQFRLEGAAALLEGLADRPHVRAVVGGHLHDAVELTGPSGPPVLIAPSTLMGITHQGDQMTIDPDAPRGARVLRLGDDGILTSRVLEA